MEKILVPIDGSKASFHALEYVAVRVRRGEKLDVQILFVQPFARPSALITRDMIKDWQKSERDKVLASPKLKTLAKRLKAHINVDIGDVAEAIITFARKNRCREIVMGSRGLGRLKGLILGSVATKVVHLAAVPVTLVK